MNTPSNTEVSRWISNANYLTSRDEHPYTYSHRLGGNFLDVIRREGYTLIETELLEKYQRVENQFLKLTQGD